MYSEWKYNVHPDDGVHRPAWLEAPERQHPDTPKDSSMDHRQLGNSGFNGSVLSFGTSAFDSLATGFSLIEQR